jgi:hypothetical protein
MDWLRRLGMTEKDIAKLLKGRGIIDAYRAQHSKGIDESAGLTDKLKAIGFTSDNPIGEFFSFNDQMCLEAIKILPIYGECDSCKGYKGTPKCQEWFGNSGCAITRKIPSKEDMHRAILIKIRAGVANSLYETQAERIAYYKGEVETGTNIHWFCTKGHGFYCKPLEVTVVEDRFSLIWR